ncbi:MAG: nitroreductase family protein [Spirochaetes bacterium]|nr:nitroreductase family protein [Spirochaetota bacterium]
MDSIEALMKRRSIRKYNNNEVSEESLNIILKSAMYAPSAYNQQLWEFVVINKREVLDIIPEIYPYSSMTREVNIAILVCGNLNEKINQSYWTLDCSAATQNILIAATSLGLGSIWLGIYPREDRIIGLRKLLKLPEYIVPFSLVPIGFSEEKKEDPKRFNPGKIHYNEW